MEKCVHCGAELYKTDTKEIGPNGRPVQKDFCYICFKYNVFKKLGYKIHHKEVERFHRSTAKKKVCWAPSRTTKSYSAAFDMLPNCLLRNTINWVVGPSYELAEKEFRVIHDQLVVNRHKLGIPKPLVCQTNLNGQLFIKWPWGAILQCKSADNMKSLLGEKVHYVIYSEAAQLPRAVPERYVTPRVITTNGTELVPSTPFGGAEWMYELCQKGQLPKYAGEIESFHWDYTANPEYDRKAIERAKKLFGEDSPEFREQYLGEWVFYGGLVYSSFNPDVHVMEPFDIPPSWPRIRAIDFGLRDPFVCLWFAVGPFGELYLYREYYERKNLSMVEHARMIKALSSGETIGLTVADPSAAQSIEDLYYHGIHCEKAINDQSAGRLRVMDYMQPTDDAKPPWPLYNSKTGGFRKKWPRYFIFNTAVETIREVKYYRFKEGRPREGDREVTEGEDHSMDTMRYAIMTRPAPFQSTFEAPVGSFDREMDSLSEHSMMRLKAYG